MERTTIIQEDEFEIMNVKYKIKGVFSVSEEDVSEPFVEIKVERVVRNVPPYSSYIEQIRLSESELYELFERAKTVFKKIRKYMDALSAADEEYEQ